MFIPNEHGQCKMKDGAEIDESLMTMFKTTLMMDCLLKGVELDSKKLEYATKLFYAAVSVGHVCNQFYKDVCNSDVNTKVAVSALAFLAIAEIVDEVDVTAEQKNQMMHTIFSSSEYFKNYDEVVKFLKSTSKHEGKTDGTDTE